MIKKTTAAGIAVLFGLSMMSTGVMAQATPDASPADCPTTTPEENVQIIEDYFDAILSGDAEAADALLADDKTHNLENPDVAESANEPGNADELENIEQAADVNHEVTHTVAQNDWVALYKNFEVSGAEIEGADPEQVVVLNVMAMARVECGVIAEAIIEFDALGLLQEFGYEIMPPSGD